MEAACTLKRIFWTKRFGVEYKNKLLESNFQVSKQKGVQTWLARGDRDSADLADSLGAGDQTRHREARTRFHTGPWCSLRKGGCPLGGRLSHLPTGVKGPGHIPPGLQVSKRQQHAGGRGGARYGSLSANSCHVGEGSTHC